MPAFNAAATLSESLASVQAQTVDDLEILVVDDGSTDRTPEIAARASATDRRIRVIRQANAGVAAARNSGIGNATGAWIAPIDADDLWHPDRLKLQLAAAEKNAVPPTLVYAWSRRIDEQGRVIGDQGRPTHRGDVLAHLTATNFLRNASSTLIRRDALLAVGGFDPSLQANGAQGAEDLSLYLALAERGTFAVAPHFLIGYRIHRQSMSRSPERMRRSIAHVLSALQRRRPDLSQELFDLAGMNYDLYTAHLALRNSSVGMALRYALQGLEKAPSTGAKLLGLASVNRFAELLFGWSGRPNFRELDTDQVAYPFAFPTMLDAILAEAVERTKRPTVAQSPAGAV